MGLAALTKKIERLSQTGLTRHEILAKLAADSPADTVKIAYAISAIPTPEKRSKYLRLNAVFIVLLLACAVLTLLSAFPIDMTKPTLFLAIKVIAPLVGCYFAFNFHGGVYRILALWFTFDLLEAIALFNAANLASVLRVPALMLAVALALLIALKVFPQLRVVGPKADGKGGFLLQ
ncbi:hypothetical protein [Desulfosediminicola flagellatus]|uniref:hypothetical protein n=1 Tax=Desulfosediminicola flagellatus TaxID=2569541 RepID=UPI0010ACAEA7|nr:hypothetical protein [Desulfosediminicola flagellatus]